MQIQPRLIRLRDAPYYLGMDKNRFNREVRRCLTEIPIGRQGIAFDRLEMDAWAEQYKNRCGCSPKHRGDFLCQSESRASTREAPRASGTLIRRLEELRKANVYGIRVERSFRQAATKFLLDYQHKRSIGRYAQSLKILDPHIGDLPLRRVHQGTLESFIRHRRNQGMRANTINRDLAVVRRILTLAARLWRDESGLTWLETAPLLQMLDCDDARKPYPLSWDEQSRFFARLPDHLREMALFKVNTGTREQEVVCLRWNWEVSIPELKTSVFVVPGGGVKNGEDRLVVMNTEARAVINR